MKHCTKCGHEMNDSDAFCPACGTSSDTGSKSSDSNSKMKWFDKVTDWINRMAGGTGAVRPPLKSIFSQVFVKHSPAESEEIFICGTSTTTPELTDNEKSWPSPWLWSRILLVFVITFALLHLCCASFGNLNAYPGLMVIGSFMIPVAVMVLFFELNTPKNISFITTVKYFLIGGVASIVITLFLNDFLAIDLNEWLDATLTGIIEETAKLAIIAFIIWRSKNAKYALNGLLIGAAIGAGFAAFESAGYAFQIFLSNLLAEDLNISVAYSEMVKNIMLRAFLAPGGHVIWAAMSGYAIMLVKGTRALTMSFLNQKAFWKIFWIPILLHAVWDMPISFGRSLIGQILPVTLLMVIGWVVTFVLIGNSLSQIGQILKAKEEAPTPQNTSEPLDVSAAVK